VSARAVFAGVAAAVLALALVPWADSPLRRLAGGEGDGPAPRFDVRLDASALREERLPVGTRYFVSAQEESPLAQGNAKAAAQLYLARGLPVQDPSSARFAVAIADGRIVIVTSALR
jgi:hypothetical protein